MPRTKEQFKEIREEKTNLIKQVAMELFASEGYIPTSIAKIAKAANISKGLMYNYFESKEELLKTIVSDGFNEALVSFDRNKDGHFSTKEFEYYVRQNFTQLKNKRSYYKLLYSIMLQPNIHDIIADIQNDASSHVFTIASEYFQSRFDDPETELVLFSSTMEGLSMQYIFAPGLISDEMLEKAITRILDYYIR